MAVDQIRKLQVAEDLLKQGRTDEALGELQRLADESPHDLLTLNRMGDMLARQGRVEDALGYYRDIAERFAGSGYLLKAVAIYKKMLRLDPDGADTIAAVGRLYVRQKLPAEGGKYLLAAAERYLATKDFPTARAIYEELVVSDPRNALHRARLAESMAAEGEVEDAGRELVRLADSLRSEGRFEDAERSYRRSAELCPEWQDPILGVSACLAEQGRAGEAVQVLEQAVAEGRSGLAGELVLRCETSGRKERVDEILGGPSGLQVAPETIEHIFKLHADRGDLAALWERFDSLLDAWSRSWPDERMIEVLQGLVGIEPGGHLPAMERLGAWFSSRPNPRPFATNIERLARALRQKGHATQAAQLLGLIGVTIPAAPVPGRKPGVTREVSRPGPSPVAVAPPVPLSRPDRDFVTGRLTQSEILEKYSLFDQAIQQLRDVTTRFPGHAEAQRRLVKLLRAAGDADGHAEALAGLALACLAEGNTQAARNSAAEALATGMLDAAASSMLEEAGLAGPFAAPATADDDDASDAALSRMFAESAASAEEVPAIAIAPDGMDQVTNAVEAVPVAVTTPVVSRAPAARPAVKLAPAVSDVSDDDEFVLDLDGIDDPSLAIAEAAAIVEATSQAADPPEKHAVGGAAGGPDDAMRRPAEEMVDEVQFYLAQGRVEDARQRIGTLTALGYGGPELDALIHELSVAEAQVPTVSSPSEESLSLFEAAAAFADDDLSTITAALEDELNEEAGPVDPEAGTEQSIESVFAAFREKVAEEIGTEDFRTHYELGIGYREMGLLEEAVAEFETAARSANLVRDAQVMLGMCRRDMGQLEAAAACYRAAVEATPDEGNQLPLRYDLADLLAQLGDLDGAAEAMREVVQVDPGFRDARERLSSLESSPKA